MRRTQRSDADGRFHLPLPAGIYIIGTDGRHWPNRLTHEERFTGRLLVYDFHFFAQSGSPRNATRVELRTGAERTDVDLPLALTPAYSVSGSVTGPRAGPALLTLKRLIDGEPLPEWFDLGTDSRDAAGRDTGHFTFPAVPAGEYWLSAVSYKSFSFGGVNLPVSEARLKISVSSDTTDLAVELRTGESAR